MSLSRFRYKIGTVLLTRARPRSPPQSPEPPEVGANILKSIVALKRRRLVVYYDSFVCCSKSTNVLRTHAGSDNVQIVNAVRSRVLFED